MKPILFNAEMVRAILDGHKSVTRRVVKPPVMNTITTPPLQPAGKPGFWAFYGEDGLRRAPYRPGYILYVRETFLEHKGNYHYKANGKHEVIDALIGGSFFKWRPSIHMPKKAARLFLRVTDARVERLQDITEEQARAEGCPGEFSREFPNLKERTSKEMFSELWDRTIKKADLPRYGWNANPWVWVIGFEKISKEEAFENA